MYKNKCIQGSHHQYKAKIAFLQDQKMCMNSCKYKSLIKEVEQKTISNTNHKTECEVRMRKSKSNTQLNAVR